MARRICFELNTLEFPIKLEQTGKDRFIVTYGQDVKAGKTYEHAAMSLG